MFYLVRFIQPLRFVTVSVGHSEDLGSTDAIEEAVSRVLRASAKRRDGEICPLPGSPMPYSHGTTFVTVLIGEDD